MVNQAKFHAARSAIEQANSYNELTAAVERMCDVTGFNWNTQRSYLANAKIAELGLMSGAADCFKLADTRLDQIMGVDQ